MSFAHVIPLLKIPFGQEGFDYRIPEGLIVRAGDLVLVPFRHKQVVALVDEVRETSAFASKTLDLVGSYADIHFPSSLLDLLRFTASRSFASSSTILTAWLRTLPKHPKAKPFLFSEHKNDSILIQATWDARAEEKLLARAKELVTQGERVLLLTPWVARANRYHVALPESFLLHSDMADGAAFLAWQTFLHEKSGCLIATRLGAWLAPLVDVVLLDEPENDDYKQDEATPRFDARRLVLWSAQQGFTSVESFGLTPPLHVEAPAPTIEVDLRLHPFHPYGRSNIPGIQADTLLALQEHEGSRVIIHPIRGSLARFTCRDCGWQAPCPACGFSLSSMATHAVCRQCGKKTEPILACAKCGGVDLGKAMPGIDRLKQLWTTREPDLTVEWRDLSNEHMDDPFSEQAMIVVTQGALLGGGGEDIKRKERQLIAFRRLAASVAACHGTLIIQGDEALTLEWSSWLTKEGVEQFTTKERETRHAFRYPPATRRVKLILQDGAPGMPDWLNTLKQNLPKDMELEGPFAVPYRTKTQTMRMIWHILVPGKTPESSLSTLLAPFAKKAIIDLDPIAFFK